AMTLAVVTLAAGKGSRMKSDLPKVLHKLAGKPMLAHVLQSAAQLPQARLHVVLGRGAEAVKEQITGFPVSWALQAEQKGTGHAVAMAEQVVVSDVAVLVLYGEVPLIRTGTLQKLWDEAHDGHARAPLTVEQADPTGYGGIVRDDAG